MKKTLFSFLFVLGSIGTWAQTFTSDGFTFKVIDADAKTVEVSKGGDTGGDLVIPSSVVNEEVTYTVVQVAESGFAYTGITSVTIPASVDNIATWAFRNCADLASVTFEDADKPLSVVSGYYGSFAWSDADKAIYIGRDLVLSENTALFGNPTSVVFSDNATTINPNLFNGSSKLASITIGTGVTEIGQSAFYGTGTDESVETLTLMMGANVQTIRESAFYGSSKLRSVALPSTLKIIEGEAFLGTALTSITIPESVDSIGDWSFRDCNSLVNVRFDDGTTALKMTSGYYGTFNWSDGDKAIYIGRDLVLSEESALFINPTSVVFGDNVTTINPNLFNGSSKLASITIGTGVTEIGQNAFYDTGTDESVETLTLMMGANVQTIKASAFYGSSKLRSVALPSTLKIIEGEAFLGTALTSITIPESVDSIGDWSFRDCDSLVNVRFDDGTTALKMTSGYYGPFNWSDGDKAIYIGRNLVLSEETALFINPTSVVFGDNVTTINPNLFNGSSKLASITIGSGVTEIGQSAFYGTGTDESVETLTLMMGANVQTIKASAFYGSSKLRSITLPSTLKITEGEAFRGTALTSITIPESVDSIGDWSFRDCDSLVNVRFDDGTTALKMTSGYYGPFNWSDGDKAIYIGRDLVLSEESALFINPTSVVFGDNVTTINPNLFNGSSKLASITIGSGVTEIGQGAFKDAGSHESVESVAVSMGDNVVTIGNNAFRNISKMTAVTLSASLTTIGDDAFASTGLSELTIPAKVTTIGQEAFAWNSSLASITIADSNEPLNLYNNYYRTFRNLSSAYSLYLGRNLEYAEKDECPFPSVASVEIGPMVTMLHHRQFYNVGNLTTVTGAEGVDSMGTEVYLNSGNLKSVSLGKALKVLPESTFENCTSLESLVLPETLTDIQQWAFYNCKALTELTIPASVQTIGKSAAGNNGYRTFYQDSGMKRLVIADSDKPLEFADTYGAFFRDMNQLEKLYLGRDITCVGHSNAPFSVAQEIEFGLNVTTIGKQLSNVTATTVKAPWQSPIAIDDAAFNASTYKDATLWIPGRTKPAYAEADGWKNFQNIELASFVVAVEASQGGSLTVGELTVTNGEKADMLIDRAALTTFVITPAEGYALASLTQNGEALTVADSTYTIPSLMNDVALVATFAPISYTISYDLADGTLDGENPTAYTIESQNITLTNPTRQGYTFAGWMGTGLEGPALTVTIATGSTGDRSYTATWERNDMMPGDVNHDGTVDVTDAVLIIDEILLKDPSNFDASLADVNHDTFIDVTDVVLVIDKILGKLELSRNAEAAYKDLTAYTAFQMDLTIPAGYVLEGVMLTEMAKDSHTLAYTMLPGGRCRIVVWSMDNEALPGAWNEVIRLQLRGQGEAQLNADHAVFVTVNGERHELLLNGTTGIAQWSTVNGQSSMVYDLQGRRVSSAVVNSSLTAPHSSLKKDLYIIDGKKFMKK